MEAFQQIAAASSTFAEPGNRDINAIAELCTITFESGERYYDVRLLADIASIALEGMNQYRIHILGRHKVSGFIEQMQTILEINLREGMNCISIEGEAPLYFSITRKSLELRDVEIDSSIHEVVDLGLMESEASTGDPGSKTRQQDALLYDKVTANLIKAGISTLLAQTTQCHKQVVQDANHLFASRQDYVRKMHHCLERNAAEMSASFTNKARHCNRRASDD